MPVPGEPLYDEGIIVNPRLNERLKGWFAVGNAKIGMGCSSSGNNYIQISNILVAQSDAISQTFTVDKDRFYTVSGKNIYV